MRKLSSRWPSAAFVDRDPQHGRAALTARRAGGLPPIIGRSTLRSKCLILRSLAGASTVWRAARENGHPVMQRTGGHRRCRPT